MTRRDARLIDALVGESRVWVEPHGMGTIWAAGRGSRKQGGAGKKGGGGKTTSGTLGQGTRPKSTASSRAKGGATASPSKRPGALKGTGKTVGKTGRSGMSRG
jgi:hypothetical protein